MKSLKRYCWYEMNEPLVDDRNEIVDAQTILLDNVTVKARRDQSWVIYDGDAI